MLPPEPLFSQIHLLKQKLSERYNTRAALKSPPHITLHMPFLRSERKESQLIAALEQFASAHKPVAVTLDNFSAFPPRVLFVNVLNTPELSSLQLELFRWCRIKLNLFNANYQDRPFHPHITLAFRDLKKDLFEQALQDLQSESLHGNFMADAITLLKHDGKQWQRFREILLG